MKILQPSLLAFALALTPALTTAYANETAAENKQSVEMRVNLNKASATQLSSLKGIGMKKAAAIIEYRDSYGPFKSVAELTNVKGIGEKFLAKNKEYLTL
ncbi:ComEA family DNA-binding protein [Thalassotalea sp. ND16A]|uniref:ComEA family DNA-binding protein n=1 Tax=Thalassotalea sp. ND16A TaxID=1535422 RepID=UPI00051A7782|nr:ComEA family DNA-binding protein [Thalassotalea sp. ND16A]KGJ99843.1 hypothetical protein ND16A_3685 [Thalassotalea sp. ND16A]